jgi:tetratricopeptide (TPR) repeat protein
MRILLAALSAVLLAVGLSAPAQAQEWYRAETAHFIVKSRDSEEATRQFAQTMERFDRGLRFLMGLPEDHVEASAANKPVIYRFGDYTDMSRIYGNASAGVGGFFISRAGAAVAFAPARRQRSNNSRDRRDRTDSIEQVLLHEYTHYFMMMNYPAAYPRWYSEGYAEMVSTMRFNDDGSFHIGDPPQSRGGIISDRPLSNLNEMLDADRQLTGYDAYQHYVTGWLFSHYMSFDRGREAKLREFLVAIGNGEDSLTAARRIIGDLNQIQRELVRYKQGPFPGYSVRPNITALPDVTVTPITGAEAALIDAEYTLKRGVTRPQARSLASRLRAAVQQYPVSSYAYGLLAEAEHDAKNYVEAEAAAARAVELDETNQHAWLVRAANALDRAVDDGTLYDPARQYIQRARRLDMSDPRPLIAYYKSFYQQTGGAGIPEQAIIALETAYDEAGDDIEYRLLMGRQLLLEERFREARVVLLPALYSGHTFEAEEEDDFTPDRLFEAIDASDRPRSLEWINKALEPDEDEEA